MEGSDRWQFFMLERQLHNFIVKNKAFALFFEKLPTIASLHARTLLEMWHTYLKLQSPISPKIQIGPKNVIEHFLLGFFSLSARIRNNISRGTPFIRVDVEQKESLLKNPTLDPMRILIVSYVGYIVGNDVEYWHRFRRRIVGNY